MMLPNPVTNRMIEELRALLSELEADVQPSNVSLEEEVRRRTMLDMRRAGEIE